ncbi:MAG: hypothetical protein QM820_44510 [Minicystis sp.]
MAIVTVVCFDHSRYHLPRRFTEVHFTITDSPRYEYHVTLTDSGGRKTWLFYDGQGNFKNSAGSESRRNIMGIENLESSAFDYFCRSGYYTSQATTSTQTVPDFSSYSDFPSL